MTEYRLLAATILIASVGAAVYLYRLRLQTWREYPLQAALKSVIGGIVVLCLNFVIPAVSVQLPFSITVSEASEPGLPTCPSRHHPIGFCSLAWR